MDFCYNARTGNIMANDRNIVYWEKYCSGYYYFIRHHGQKQYLTQRELSSLAKTAKWFIENRGCNFDEPVRALAQSYLARKN